MLMAAACFPEEQAKVQAELDAVIGRHRGSLNPYCSVLDSMILQRRPSLMNNPFLVSTLSSLRFIDGDP